MDGSFDYTVWGCGTGGRQNESYYSVSGGENMQALDSLRALLRELPSRLEALPPDAVEAKPSASWSVKEEFGHLLDSAANNHQRIVRTQLEEKPAMPGYDGDAWGALHQAQHR